MESLLQRQKSKASTAHERILASNQELSRENERLQHLVSQLRLSSRGLSRSPGPEQDVPMQSDAVYFAARDNGGAEPEGTLLEEHDLTVSRNGIRTLHDEAKALEVEALQAELSAQQKSNDILTTQMQQMQVDIHQAKADNAELRDQNETYMNMLQEETLSGALIERSAVLNRRYMDSDTEESEEVESDDVDDVPDEPRKQSRGGRKERAVKRSQELRSLPTSLASELEKSGNSEEAKKRDRRKDRSEALTDNIEDLHKEIWSLRDANQALTLYVTKILDRIISKEGYENVLAIDGDEKSKMGTLRGTSSRLRGQPSRPSLANTQSPPKPGRRASGAGLLSFMASNAIGNTGDSTEPNTPTPASPSFAARARRTASIDWRSLIGAASPTSPVQQTALMGAMTPAPRKISSSEEVEDIHDVEEKERIRREMISHGIQLPDNQLKSQKRASGVGTFFSRVMGVGGALPASVEAKEQESVVDQSDQHPGPRMATFDSPQSMKSSLLGRATSGGADSSTRSSSPLDRIDARQRALDMGNPAGNLTEVPRRTSPISSRRNTMKRRDTSSSSGVGAAGSSRGESVAGDESFQLNSPAMGSDKALEEDNDSSWGKTFKRMSLIAARGERAS